MSCTVFRSFNLFALPFSSCPRQRLHLSDSFRQLQRMICLHIFEHFLHSAHRNPAIQIPLLWQQLQLERSISNQASKQQITLNHAPQQKHTKQLPSRKEMCRAILLVNNRCGHRYLELKRSCAPGRDLLSCPMFRDGATTIHGRLPPFEEYCAPRYSCPYCDCRGNYDMRVYRMVWGIRRGVRIGLGPSRRNPGCDCIVM
jgi:hypothetical protein